MNRIKELRKAKKLSQAALAEEIGCTPATVSKYELEQIKLPGLTLTKLCELFNCNADYLLGLSDENAIGSSMPAFNAEDSMDFERLQKANMLFLELNETGKAQATAYLEFLVAQQQKREG